ncbi:DNA polymerase IV [Skermania sp. ID1734]|uniref:DNA polymerase IV n=1 Tax=Skermania sp. ID1734 TaxID=2597516 RepID=UPI00117DECC6|nr:DNA polymerase IV [Skermania sp. ID1734]TSD99232.1 DNA polymerase IV [Skermania sp. ID1734]
MFVSAEPHILHADLDAFYASVEQRDNPALRGRPVIVGGGVVLAASYEAKAFGVRTAIGGREALRLCPQAVVVPARFDAYLAASKAVFGIFRNTTPNVEGISIDEAFLDVRGVRRISGNPRAIAEQLRRDVREQVGLPITVGIARTKFLAKVASAVGKPDGLLEVPTDSELEFLHPLPVERLWGVGKVTSRRLRERGITTVGDLAALGEPVLTSMLGNGAGRHLYALAMARDPRRVQTGRRRRSIGSQHALGRGPTSSEDLEAIVVGIIDRVSKRLRKAGRRCRTVVLRLRFGDFTRATRSHTLRHPTSHTETLRAVAQELLRAAMPMLAERGCTLVGISLSNLDNESTAQLELPLDSQPRPEIDCAIDALRERFGAGVLTRAVLIGRQPRPQVPLLPD